MKTGKFIAIESANQFNVGYGSVNIKELKSIYINLSSWVTPNYDHLNWGKLISDIRRQIIFEIKQELHKSEIFRTNHIIVNLDIKTNGLEKGKKSFLNCEITIFVKKQIPITNEKLKNEIEIISQNVIDQCFLPINHFKYQKTKHT